MYVVDVDDVIKDTLEIVKKKLFSLGKKSMFLILSFPISMVFQLFSNPSGIKKTLELAALALGFFLFLRDWKIVGKP